MRFALETTEFFDKQFKKLPPAFRASIVAYLKKNIEGSTNPRSCGKVLKGNLTGLWRYRVGDYRIICEIQEDRLVVLGLVVGHRRDVYKK